MIQSLEQHRTGPHELDDKGAEIPTPINKFLRKYQREGVEFLWGQWKKRMGGILGDDMVRLFTFLESLRDAYPSRTLIGSR